MLSAIVAVDAVTLFAQGGTQSAEAGTLTLSDEKWPLKHVVAYEMPRDDGATIVVGGPAANVKPTVTGIFSPKKSASPLVVS